eukprot:2461296-Amphidinium_carterae.1
MSWGTTCWVVQVMPLGSDVHCLRCCCGGDGNKLCGISSASEALETMPRVCMASSLDSSSSLTLEAQSPNV